MIRSLRFLLFAGFIFAATPANAEQCAYVAFKPSSLFNRIVETLAEHGATVAPGNAFGMDGFVVVKDHLATGRIAFSKDRVHGDETLAISDADGRVLATAELKVGVQRDHEGRPVGRSNWVRIWTAVDAADDGEVEPFHLIDDLGGIRYYRFNRAMNVTLWRVQLGESLDWLAGLLLDSSYGREIKRVGLGASELMEQAFAMDSDLLPYRGRLGYRVDLSGYLVVSGAVESNYIYSRILDVASEQGLRIRPNLVIDTRLEVRRTDLPVAGVCSR